MTRSAAVRSNASRNVGISVGIVLPVGVEGDHRFRVVGERPGETGSQRRTLALVRALDDDGRAGRLGPGRGAVGRAVIHDEDRQVAVARRTTAPTRGPSSKAGMSATTSVTAQR